MNSQHRSRGLAILALVASCLVGTAGRARAATFVSDTFTGSAPGHFAFTGRWEHVRKINDGRFFGSSSRTNDLTAVATISFVGRVFRLYGVRGPGGGYGIVSIDGTRYPQIDFHNAKKQPRAVIFSSPLLATGLHTVRIGVVVDPRPSVAHARYINLSGAVYQ